ncbi:MAG: hypothetical protein LBG52_08600 [Candidatus Peribacteria bacterium]|jgi:hypothetical protein|nr:hypothetical protein [Candidatus Peribacteria bacterium]
MLPFYWNIERIDGDKFSEMNGDYANALNNYKKVDTSCTENGTIGLDTMICTFNVYNGQKTQDKVKKERETPVYEITMPCFTKDTDRNKEWNSNLLSAFIRWNQNNFIKDGNANGGNTFWSYNPISTTREFAFRSSMFVIDNFGNTTTPNNNQTELEKMGVKVLQSSEQVDVYGEYKLSLDAVDYLQCTNGRREKQTPFPRVCEINFSVVKPYVLQKTPAGTINTTTQDLSKFYAWSNPTQVFNFNTYLSNVLASNANTTYRENTAVKNALNSFINKYSKLAVTVEGVSALFGNATVRKVPGKSIYFVEGDLTIDGYGYKYDISKSKIENTIGDKTKYKQPFTIVQTLGSTTIVGNLDHNMMLLTNGKITFNGSKNCNDTQVLRGIFYAGMGFEGTEVKKNNKLSNTDRCIGGNLHIKGIVIGEGLQAVANARRSELNQWFWASNNTSASLANRRNYIMNGAAVLIEYAPSVFTKSTMPPGAEEFTTALEVYKK